MSTSSKRELVAQVLADRAERFGDRVAIEVDRGASITYSEWDSRSTRLARALHAAGLQPSDRVALRIGNANAVDYVVAYFAVQKAGGVAVPINTRLAPREACELIAHAEPFAMLAEAGSDEQVEAIRERLREPVSVWSTGPRCDVDWPEAERSQPTTELRVERGPDDLADILYTSGTTGRPKGVASTQRDVARLAENRAVRMLEGATFLHAFPLYTFAGTHGMTMMGLAGVLTTIVQPRFDAARALELIEARAIAVAYLAPAMLRLMLARPELVERDTSSLKLLLYGSAATSAETIRRLADAFPRTMQVNVYGLTEGGAASCSLRPTDALERPGSIGRPNPPAEVGIRSETGDSVPAGTTGEIWMRLPGARRRYFRDEEATARAWTEDGWLRTGDLGHLDSDGYLYLDGRKRDVIIRGGHNVFPDDVEAVLLEHPDVEEAAVVGIPHEILGEDLKACIVLRDGSTVPIDTITDFCRERLADYKVPRTIEVLPDLPKNAMGKVLRRLLRGEPA